MIQSRKQSTTDYPIVFLMVDSSDHVTGKTGLTPTVTISKNGGAFGAAAGAVTELANGWYSLAGNASDRNTLGSLAIHASTSGADPCDLLVLITSYDPFVDVSSILSKTDNLPSDPADESLLEAAITAAIPTVPTVEQIRQEMDANSTRLATIAGDTTTDIPALIAALDTNSVLSAAVEGTITVQQALRIVLAEMVGKATGGGTATITYRNPGDTKDRVIMTVDANGNRSDITTDLT